jgi:hypothetical protein
MQLWENLIVLSLTMIGEQLRDEEVAKVMRSQAP